MTSIFILMNQSVSCVSVFERERERWRAKRRREGRGGMVRLDKHVDKYREKGRELSQIKLTKFISIYGSMPISESSWLKNKQKSGGHLLAHLPCLNYLSCTVLCFDNKDSLKPQPKVLKGKDGRSR